MINDTICITKTSLHRCATIIETKSASHNCNSNTTQGKNDNSIKEENILNSASFIYEKQGNFDNNACSMYLIYFNTYRHVLRQFLSKTMHSIN